MSMFSGLGNQISGFVAQKMGGPAPAEGEPAEGQVPVEGQVEGQAAENGEVPPEGGAMGGAMGFAQGLMMKAAAVKEGVAAKAGGMAGGNMAAPFGGGGAQEGEVMEGGEQMGEGGVPVEGVEGEPQPGAMGFAAGLMMKAHSLKEGVKEKSSGINLGNVQGIGSMAGGVMGQVQGLIPGMKREEDVPDPAPPAEGEYQEYAEDPNQYQEEQYTE
eukprot:TRINITY_DN1776_c0_g1_i2.p1 TRINITY_DN1776_c0_g1~~TRINITY_DN1776_c0_g1_i2.p1  ORF type:complete len:215 (+),score=61.25 TRINITY_DN1776_c0_g1_i2:194-838(+)